MAYSCTDFADDVLNDLLIRSWIQSAQFGPEDMQAQCGAVLAAIGDADRALHLAADAKQFHAELLDAVETLTAIGEEHGPVALAHLVYLQMAILKGTLVELTREEAASLSFVRDLPSGGRWWKHVDVTEAFGS
ncbi:hypothetical protein [Caballeronia sp. J97]|uniref:hypothetical protein n=1 Tax=Caballeronia sp. J97 TaxID=2805429 RepID=UPI002AB05FB1|nr:hypothetical protein [Caballeronia sp. J97]